jgi:hypothetical protein
MPEIDEEEKKFAALNRQQREKAFKLLRARFGKNHRIAICELIKAHEFIQAGGDDCLPVKKTTATSSSEPGESLRPVGKWAGGFNGPVAVF